MAVGTNFPVESIEDLSGKIKSQSANLESTLSSLRAQCQRDPQFTGTAATKYDEYLSQWDSSQRTMLTSLNGAATLLDQLAAHLREVGDAAANAFNV